MANKLFNQIQLYISIFIDFRINSILPIFLNVHSVERNLI